MTRQAATLQRGKDVSIAYHHTPGQTPGVLFCTGFKSDMTGSKALAMEAYCRENGQQFTRFDYQGHGESSGRFENGTIGEWLADTLAVIDEITDGPLVIVGSSMGGWIGLLAALARPDRVRGFVGIATAIDFVRRIWDGIDDDARRLLETEGVWMRPSEYDPAGYPITRTLLEEGRNHLLLPGPIKFDGVVRLLHGQLDDAVPWRGSLDIAEALTGTDVTVTCIKDAGHRLSRDQDIARILGATAEITEILRAT